MHVFMGRELKNVPLTKVGAERQVEAPYTHLQMCVCVYKGRFASKLIP
jgi:hypothetical protein